jgi:hypothetical protein
MCGGRDRAARATADVHHVVGRRQRGEIGHHAGAGATTGQHDQAQCQAQRPAETDSAGMVIDGGHRLRVHSNVLLGV